MRVRGRALSLGKTGLRRAAEERRRATTPQARAEGDRLRSALLEPLLRGAVVASYVPFGTEPVPPPVPGALLPVLLPDKDLSWRTDGGPDRGRDAVAACDVVLVPALAVDRTGTRLGRGGGSYDRALARATGLVVALLHEGELLEALPAEPHDVGVDVVALPSGLVRLSEKVGP